MGRWTTARVSRWWTGGGEYAASTSRRKTGSWAGSFTISGSSNAKNDTRSPDRQRHTQCHRRDTPVVGLYANPAQTDRDASQSDAVGVRRILRVSGLL